MIDLRINIQQVGGYLVMKYHTEENSSTDPEKREVRDLVRYLQVQIAKDGGKGTFVENEGEKGIANGDDN